MNARSDKGQPAPGPWRLLLSVLLLFVGAIGLGDSAPDTMEAEPAGLGERYALTTSKPYEGVVLDAEYAITEHNFRLTGRNRIGEAIAERGGRYPGHTVLEFCNLEYARRLLDVHSRYLLYMPCRLAISQDAEGTTVATYLLPEDEPAAREVNAILKAIVRAAAE